MRPTIIILLLFAFFNETKSQIIKVWEISEGLVAPESVVYDSESNLLYVSNYTRSMANGSTYADCFVSKVDLNGQIIDREWISNLSSPTGLFLKDSLLYIVERFGVAVYDVKNDKMSKRHHIIHDGFINDVAVDNEQNIYVTDSGSEILYRIKENEVSNWIVSDSIANANGISFIDNMIYIGVNRDNFLKSIDPKTKQISKISYLGEGNIDGIKKREDELIISLYTKGLRLLKKNGKTIELLNTESTGLHCTDFEYISDLDMLVVPSLYDNKLIAYKFKKKQEKKEE